MRAGTFVSRLGLTTLALSLSLAALAADAPAVVKTERGDLILENVPDTPRAIRERLRQYNNVRSAAFADFLPDGSVLIQTRFAETPQLHAVRTPLGARRQLTFYDERIASAEVRPGGSGEIAFTQDTGGDEYFQGNLLDPKTGLATSFTEVGTRNQSLVFSRDGARIAWSKQTRDSGDTDILVADTGKQGRVLLKGHGALAVLDWSPAGDRLLLLQFISITKTRLFVLDMQGTQTELTPELNVAYGGGQFTADSKAILTTTDENSDFQRLALLDLATGARTVLTPDAQWDVESFDLTEDGKTAAYVLNVGGASELHVMDMAARRDLAAPKLPPGVIANLGWNDSGSVLGITLASATAPADVYVYDLKSTTLTRWTQSEIGGLPPTIFVEPTLERFPTFDSSSGGPKEITAWVYEPRTAGRRPAVIVIHGGPEGQSRPQLASTIQYWVNELGLAVIVPNVRGSSGYGKAFVSLDNGLKRLDSVKDIGAVLDWMAKNPKRFDMKRVVPYGGSYGGFMVYASMVMYPQRFAAGIDIVGIGNLRSFLENTSGYRRDLRRAEYGDEREPEMRAWMEKTASLNNVDKLEKPMLIIHGANDPRVPISEAKAMVAALRQKGVETWFMIAKSEGHGYGRKANQEAQREAETLFLQKVLKL